MLQERVLLVPVIPETSVEQLLAAMKPVAADRLPDEDWLLSQLTAPADGEGDLNG